jgi:RNA polymerase sigma-70 factor (ECF subfamily)
MADWEEILSRDGPAAWRTAYRLLGNRAEADDCFQEACLAAVELARCEDVRHWRALLQRLVTARAMDRLRSRNRARRHETLSQGSELADDSLSPLQRVEEAELVAELRLALGRIPPRQAEVFWLHSLEDWSYEAIAAHSKLSISAVGVLLHRARKRLRGLLGRFEERPQPLSRPSSERSTHEPG